MKLKITKLFLKLNWLFFVSQLAPMHQPMALKFIPKLSPQSIILVMVLAMAPFPLPVRATPKSKETQLSLYLQDITAGPNARDIPLVGLPPSSGATPNLPQVTPLMT
ncbi:hypothetical protein FF1_045569 [Malus domestica]